MAKGDDDPPEPDDDAPVDPDDDLVDPTDDDEPVTLDALRRFLNTADSYARARRIVRRKVTGQDVDDVVGSAITDAMRAKRLPSKPRMQAWVDRVCRRAIARYFRKKISQARFQGRMENAPVRTDEAGLPIDDPYDDAIVDIDPSIDPTADTPQRRGWLFRRFLDEQTKDDPAERSTFELMCEHLDDDKTYEEIARERKIPVGTLNSRVNRLSTKYADKFEKYRNSVFMLAALGAAIVIAITAIVWGISRHGPKYEPPSSDPPPPAPTVWFVPHPDKVAPPAPSLLPVPPPPPQPVPRLKP
jgi:DNA-directed RNA polymerase specialized sigma24 family protein